MKCDNCGDSIRKGGLAKMHINGKRKFTFDIGCGLLLEKRGVIKIKGQRYRLVNK